MMKLMYRSLANNDQFLADGFTLLNGKTNLTKLENKLAEITADYTQDYAVDEMERTLVRNGFQVLWEDEGYRII